jgi:hypothetical protein
VSISSPRLAQAESSWSRRRRTFSAEISELQNTAMKTPTSKVGNDGSPKGAGRNNGGAMKDRILKVLEALRKLNPGSADKLTTEFNGLSEDKHGDFLDKVNEQVMVAAEAATTNASQGRSR